LFASIVHGGHRVFVLTQIGDLLGRQIKPIDISVPHSCAKHDAETQRTLVCPYPILHYTRAWRLQTCTQAQQRGDQISLFARWQRHRRDGLSRQRNMSKWRHRWKLTLGIPCPRKRPIADLGLLARNALERCCQREVKTARNGLRIFRHMLVVVSMIDIPAMVNNYCGCVWSTSPYGKNKACLT
jgi:hypothetical protein